MDTERHLSRYGLQRPSNHRLVRRITRLIALIFALVFVPTADAQNEAHSTGPGSGRLFPDVPRGGCEEFLLSSDETYENGYCWQYGGLLPPDYGSFAECFTGGPVIVCAVAFDFSQTGGQGSQVMDVYIWDDDQGLPGAVRCVEAGANPGPIGFWPSITRHLIDINCATDEVYWAGYWADFTAACGWFVGADTDGPGGCPVTKIAPGTGFPSGWQDVSVAWGPTQAIGIGVEVTADVPAAGACCHPDGSCSFRLPESCEHEFLGSGTSCDPNPCPEPEDGACCLEIGTCLFVDPFECDDLDGQYVGDGVGCDPNPCPQPPVGACCLDNGECLFVDPFECGDEGGDYLGDDISCDPNPCPIPPDGACCFPDGSCQFVDAYECSELGGSSWTEGVSCESEPCPAPEFGACCLSEENCVELFDYECDAQGGRFEGADTVCDDVVCQPPCNAPLPERSVPMAVTSRGANAGGTLILALSEGTVYTGDTDDYCGTVTTQDCAEAVTQVNTSDTVVINVLAAFHPSGSPRLAGVAFGVDYGTCIVLSDWGYCGVFEFATSAWPDPGEGTAVTWGEAQESSFTEVYWFAAYGYTNTPGVLCLIPHPTQGANFADDSVPSVLDAIAGLGCFGFYTAGDAPCPEPPGTGACCYGPEDCVDGITQAGCEDAGGTYGGDGSSCTDPGFCESLPLGACCLEDGSCAHLERDICDALGGSYQGDGTDCQTVDCSTNPTIESSWGEIKSVFREQSRRKR